MARTPVTRGRKPIWASIMLSVWASVFLAATLCVPFVKPDFTFAEMMTTVAFTVTVAFGLLVAAGVLSVSAFKTIVGAIKPGASQ